jgi:decaprenyl-phosphate phosphoribosyltransferase
MPTSSGKLMFELTESTQGIRNYVALLRPRQWAKNLFVLLPAFFVGRITEFSLLGRTLIAAISLCAIASAIYIVNDVRDREADRQHPTKRLRALASGRVSVTGALVLASFLSIAGLAAAWALGALVAELFVFYLVLNLAYSFGLKRAPILDIFIVSAGYVIRIFIGGAVGDVRISMWIIIMTFLLALFITLGKRRDDVLILDESGAKVRKALNGYDLPFIDSAMMIMAAVNVVSYIMYTVSPDVIAKFHTNKLYITTLFVLLGTLRYLQLTYVEKRSCCPTDILFEDRFIQLTLVGWIVAFMVIIYWK